MPNQNPKQIARDSKDKQLSTCGLIIRWEANSMFVINGRNHQPKFASG